MALESQRPFTATTGRLYYNAINNRNLKGTKTKKSGKLHNNFFYIGIVVCLLIISFLSAYMIWSFIRINALKIELQKLQARFESLEQGCKITKQDAYRDLVSDKISDIVDHKQRAALKHSVKENELTDNTYKFYKSIAGKDLQDNINFEKDFDTNQHHQNSRRAVHRKKKRSLSTTPITGDVVSESKSHERLIERYQPELRELSDGSLVNRLKATKRTAHNRNPAAHFHLTSKHTSLKHPKHHINSYGGDIYIGSASWTNQFDSNNYFHLDNGLLTVVESGLYFIYAQICYNNTYNHNGFVVFHGQKPFLQCLSVVPTDLALKTHTCHTSGIIYLNANEHIHLRDLHSERNVILRELNNRSYFGIMKI